MDKEVGEGGRGVAMMLPLGDKGEWPAKLVLDEVSVTGTATIGVIGGGGAPEFIPMAEDDTILLAEAEDDTMDPRGEPPKSWCARANRSWSGACCSGAACCCCCSITLTKEESLPDTSVSTAWLILARLGGRSPASKIC